MSLGDKDLEDMSTPELVSEMRHMAVAVSEMAISMKTLAENDIRRQERETRQEEFNVRMDKRLTKVEGTINDVLLARASESQSRAFLNKYWPILLGLCMSALSYFKFKI